MLDPGPWQCHLDQRTAVNHTHREMRSKIHSIERLNLSFNQLNQ